MNENNNNRQMTFFDVSKFEINNINEHYQDLPEYNNVNIPKPEIVATFKFRTKEDFDLFHSVIKKELYNNERVFDGMQRKDVKNAWFPQREKASKFRYNDK